MDYQTFIITMRDRMKAEMQPETEVEVYRAVKNNGMLRTGLLFTQTGVNISPTIYLEEFYEQYLQGSTFDALAQKLQKIYEEVKIKQSISYQHILDFSQIQNRIVYKLILIPESFGMERQQLEVMVKEINETEVAAEEVLSDTVYYYDREMESIFM